MRRTVASSLALAICLATSLATAAPAVGRYADSLYSQLDHPGSTFASSSQFASPGDEQYSTEVADDFTVPIDEVWQLRRVDVRGDFNRSLTPVEPPNILNVRLYRRGGAMPGALLYSQSLPAVQQPNYYASLPSAPVLIPGRYWISVQRIVYSSSPMGSIRWAWQTRDELSGRIAVAKCPNWQPRALCQPGTTGPDQLFSVGGQADPLLDIGRSHSKPNGTAAIRVYSPVAGRASVRDFRGGAGRIKVLHTRLEGALAGQAGKVLQVVPKKRLRQRLKDGETIKLSVVFGFRPDGGDQFLDKRKVKLKLRPADAG